MSIDAHDPATEAARQLGAWRNIVAPTSASANGQPPKMSLMIPYSPLSGRTDTAEKHISSRVPSFHVT
jgi:hypothetical protein